MQFVLLLISIIPGVIPHSICSLNICLRWTSKQGVLKIICKIDDLHLPVYIHNNFGEEIARCHIPFPFPLCTTELNNTAVHQNVISNETIVRVKGRIDHSINGNWTCHHGYGRNKYKAYIEINIPSLTGQNKTEENDELRCLKEISFYTMGGVIIAVVMFGIYLSIMYTCKKQGGQNFNKMVSFFEMIDELFGKNIVNKDSVKYKKIVLLMCLVLLVLLAGVVIGILEKDSCKGSFAFLILGMLLCPTLIILLLREKGDGGPPVVGDGEPHVVGDGGPPVVGAVIPPNEGDRGPSVVGDGGLPVVGERGASGVDGGGAIVVDGELPLDKGDKGFPAVDGRGSLVVDLVNALVVDSEVEIVRGRSPVSNDGEARVSGEGDTHVLNVGEAHCSGERGETGLDKKGESGLSDVEENEYTPLNMVNTK